jgi:hypothetical protein
MALRRIQRHEIDLRAGDAQSVRDFFLLRQWEQDVGGHADYEGAFHVDAFERRGDAAVLRL